VTPERWRQINQVFHAALERTGDARAAFLDQATRDDPDLLQEVQSLLETHARTAGFLDRPAYGVAADLILEHGALDGKTIGSYRILHEIGRGGMGVVYEAEDERLGRPVALKALTPEFTRDALRRERLTREARAAAALSHPAIATIFALEEIDGELYIVSELVRGHTLREELGNGPLPPERLITTLLDVASALAAAHEHGIIHRDLKPENIARRTDGQIKVLDFGLARTAPDGAGPTATRLTERGIALGTPGYMAPEQLAGEEVDARADIFAFGVLAWELATGEHPFGADQAALVARMTELLEGRGGVLSRALPIPGLDRIARRCMRAARADRYPSASLLLTDLRDVADRIARPPGTASRDSGADRFRDSGGRAAETANALWWWQFHQRAIAILNLTMPILGWWIRKVAGRPHGSWIFFATLALATLSVTLRLNLSFVSRVQGELLVEQRRRLFPAILTSDVLLAVVLLAAAAIVAGTNDVLAAICLAVALVSLTSLALIEPATTRAAGLNK
jgi:eukaryotic-like serine/threonine-protein kinase